MANDTVEFDCELINETPKAYQIEVAWRKKTKTLWVPKSQSEVIGSKNGTKVIIPQWLAEKEDLA